MNWKIPLFKIYTDKKDLDAVLKEVKSGMNWAIGPKIEEFEKKLAVYVGTKYVLVFNSGTSALHALMLGYNFGPGDEIIVPSFSFIATANASLFVGAKPVFAEIEDKTFGLDPQDIEKKITKHTRAIMPVHYGGQACQIQRIQEIAKKHGLLLIEDAAESLGAKIGEKKVGTFGDSAVFSFCGPKVITTGEGGAVVTDNLNLYEKLKLIRSHGRLETANYFASTKYMDYVALGYNFRMSNIVAALGISQLGKINKVIKMRRKNVEYLNQKLAAVKEIELPNVLKGYFHVYQMYTLKIKAGKKVRDALKDYLGERGIMSKVFFNPIHLAEFYRRNFGYQKGDLPITEKISDKTLTLPLYPTLSRKEGEYMTKEIKKFFKYAKE